MNPFKRDALLGRLIFRVWQLQSAHGPDT